MRAHLIHAFVALTLIASTLYVLFGQDRAPRTALVRNAARNDLLRQLAPPHGSPSTACRATELVLIQKYPKAHESEETVGTYDLLVLRSNDEARARLQKADKDLEVIQNELSYNRHLAGGAL